MIIATHNGTFHADETTACAILTYLFENSSIIRSRDPEELEKADIIIDVSNQNDEKHFDCLLYTSDAADETLEL